MVWGTFNGHGERAIYKWGPIKIDSKKYVRMLSHTFVPLWSTIKCQEGRNPKFYQDNAPIHKSTHTLKYLKKKEISCLTAPPYSPDLNPMENVWALLVRKVYADGKVYQSTDELWASIQDAMSKIADQTLENLALSVNGRLQAVIQARGSWTKY